MSVKKTKFVALLAAAALTLSACGSSDDSAESTGAEETTSSESAGPSGTLNVAAAYKTTNFHPSNTSSAFAYGTNIHVVEGLYELDFQDFTARKALAAEDEPTQISDLEYEVTLREGAAFSDGTPVTADDVVASYKRIIEGETDGSGATVSSSYAAFISFIESIEAKDETTVTIKLSQPQQYLKERLADIKVLKADSTFDENTQMPIGTGPYMYESIDPEKSATAVPNPHYTGDKPAKLEKIYWTSETDDTARVTAALGGTVDIVENVDPAGADKLKEQGWVVEEATGYGIAMAMFNTTAEPFNSADVRRAVLTGIDTQTLIDTAVGGMGVEATSVLPEMNDNYKEASVQFSYDLEAAKTALADAGVATGTEINVLTTDHTWISGMGPQLQQNLEALGFTVNLETLASADLWNNNVANGDFDLVIAPGDPSTFGADPGIILKGWFYADLFMVDRFRLAESDPAAYDALVAAMNEADALTGEEGKAAWGEVQDMISEQAPLYPLFFHTILTAYNPEKVDGVTPIGVTGLQLLDVTVK